MGKMRCMDMFLITKIPMYIVFNPCANVVQCAWARLVAHLYQGPQNLFGMHKKFEYSMDDEVTKLMLETQNNTLSMYTIYERSPQVSKS